MTLILISAALFFIAWMMIRKDSNRDTLPKLTVKGRLLPDMIALPWQNVRTRLTAAQWEQIRQVVLTRNDEKCEICKRHIGKSLHVHEKWKIDRPTGTQSLVGLMGLCSNCHGVFHILNSYSRGVGAQIRQHMINVNNWTDSEADRAIAESKAIVKCLSGYYHLDLTYLNDDKFKFLTDKFKKRIVFTKAENHNCLKNGKVY